MPVLERTGTSIAPSCCQILLRDANGHTIHVRAWFQRIPLESPSFTTSQAILILKSCCCVKQVDCTWIQPRAL